MTLARSYLDSALFELRRTKRLGEGALGQLRDADEWHRKADADANSCAVLVQHLWGNMLSRWTDFLTADGEKPTRKRDAEFEDQRHDPETLRALWDEGWACCLGAVEALGESDLDRTIRIRGEPLSVVDAIQRQLAHYSYRVRQIVQPARPIRGAAGTSRSLPKGE